MKKILILIISFFLLNSCTGVKSVFQKETKTNSTEKTTSKSDSISKETINKKIDDTAIINIPKSETKDKDFDAAVNKAVTNILKSINFQKSSGDNNYKLYFDEKLDQLKLELQIGETNNKETSLNNKETSEKTFEETVNENTKKFVKMIPWWVWVILVWFLRKHIIAIIGIFVPGVSQIKTIQDLLNPPNKKEDG